MNTPLGHRALAALALCGVLFGLCVWFGTLDPVPGLGSYPGEAAVGEAPEDHVGEAVELAGRVVATDPVVVEMDYGTGSRRLVVTDLDHPVNEGDTLRLFGVLTDPETVRATNSFAVPPWGATYTYTVSFLAGLWVLARVCTQWRVDPGRGLVRRQRPLRPLAWLRRLLSPGEVTDSDA